MSSDTVLEVQGISKTYRLYRHPSHRIAEILGRRPRHVPFEALRDVGFSVRRGETVGLLGVNGSGKSTLLQILAGTTTPSSGSIRIRGRVAALLQLGTGFIPELSGRKNAVLALRILGLDDAQANAKVAWIEDFSGLAGHMDKAIKFYSSGMYARLAFSVATSVSPDIVLVDEALSVGDAGFQRKAETHLRNELAETTKIVVNHDLTSIARHCDRVIVLDAGRVLFDGATRDGLTFFHDLRGRTGKETDVAIDEVEFDGGGGEVCAGERMTLRCVLRSCVAATVDVHLGFGWRDPLGRPAFGNQEALGLQIPSGARIPVELDFVWPSLLDGDYYLDLWASSKASGQPLAERGSCIRVSNRGPRTAFSEFPSVVDVLHSSDATWTERRLRAVSA